MYFWTPARDVVVVFCSGTMMIMRIPVRKGEDHEYNNRPAPRPEKSTNVYLTAALVEKDRSLDMNLSVTLDALLAQATEEKQRQRQQEKADMQVMNAFMEKAGTITDDDFFGSL